MTVHHFGLQRFQCSDSYRYRNDATPFMNLRMFGLLVLTGRPACPRVGGEMPQWRESMPTDGAQPEGPTPRASSYKRAPWEMPLPI